MFTDEDYRNYFDELENISKEALTVYTDTVNELSNNAIRSKLYPIVSDSIETFRFIKMCKEKFMPKV
jgi:hypothetical protein